MRVTTWMLLLVLVTAPGCLLHPFHMDDQKSQVSNLPRVPSGPVTADQVQTKNAHEQAHALYDELDSDEARLAKDTKNSGR